MSHDTPPVQPTHIRSDGALLPRPTAELLDGVGQAIRVAVEGFHAECFKYGCDLRAIPDVWESAGRAAFAHIAMAGGAKVTPAHPPTCF